MAGDPSIRGLTGALETGLAGVKRGQVKLDSTARPFNLIAQTVENVLNTGSATFSWRELPQRQAADGRGPPRLHRVQADSRLQRAGARQGCDRRHPAGRQRPAFRRRIWRAGQAHRAGSDRQRGIRHRPGRCHQERNRHGHRRAVHSLDGAALAEDHLRGVRQSLHRPFHHHRRRPDDGGIAEPALDRVRGAVRRPRRRFRHSVQRPLPLRALQGQRAEGGAGAGGRALGGAAVAGRDGHRGRFPVVPADRLQGHFGTRRDRRRRHAGRVHHQHHRAASDSETAQPARGNGTGRLRIPGTARPFSGRPSRRHHRRHAPDRDSRPAAALLPPLRLQPDQSAQSQGRVRSRPFST